MGMEWMEREGEKGGLINRRKKTRMIFQCNTAKTKKHMKKKHFTNQHDLPRHESLSPLTMLGAWNKK